MYATTVLFIGGKLLIICVQVVLPKLQVQTIFSGAEPQVKNKKQDGGLTRFPLQSIR